MCNFCEHSKGENWKDPYNLSKHSPVPQIFLEPQELVVLFKKVYLQGKCVYSPPLEAQSKKKNSTEVEMG